MNVSRHTVTNDEAAEVLVVDDDRKTVELIRLYLERDGHRVRVAHDGGQALVAVRDRAPDLVVLDLMLPRVDGLDVCRALRAQGSLPIIMLTARSTEGDKLAGLELGADDYLTKPFSPRELAARVKAVLRRSGRGESGDTRDEPVQRIGGLEIDRARREVRVEGRAVELTRREFELLSVLARTPGRVFTRFELLQRAFGLDYSGMERTRRGLLASPRPAGRCQPRCST
ncbi:MAG TPA: response regulator transcription factor [Chloroflexota bacterium]|nr:response regulator transcription factor [Chloroflexota bacterium]